MANSATRTAKYSSFLGSQSSAVYHYGTNANGDIGSVWYAPSQGGSIFSPESGASGLAALVADAKVRQVTRSMVQVLTVCAIVWSLLMRGMVCHYKIQAHTVSAFCVRLAFTYFLFTHKHLLEIQTDSGWYGI
jgi:hypothetical protein